MQSQMCIRYSNPNAPRNDGTTPISIAAEKGHVEILKMLMPTTGNPNAPDNDPKHGKQEMLEIVNDLYENDDDPKPKKICLSKQT